MKIPDKIFATILFLEIIATTIIYFFFSAWDGGYCNQPSIFNPLGYTSGGSCIDIALHTDRGGIPFYVALDVTIVTIIIWAIYKMMLFLKKKQQNS